MRQFRVTWDSYQKNIITGFSVLQQREEFVDMTIAAASHVVRVHQNLLALASPYLKEMIQSIPCKHPVIFLNNIDAETLSYLLEYIYTGEVTIPLNSMDTFTKACKDLHIIGVPPSFFPKTTTVNDNSQLSRPDMNNLENVSDADTDHRVLQEHCMPNNSLQTGNLATNYQCLQPSITCKEPLQNNIKYLLNQKPIASEKTDLNITTSNKDVDNYLMLHQKGTNHKQLSHKNIKEPESHNIVNISELSNIEDITLTGVNNSHVNLLNSNSGPLVLSDDNEAEVERFVSKNLANQERTGTEDEREHIQLDNTSNTIVQLDYSNDLLGRNMNTNNANQINLINKLNIPSLNLNQEVDVDCVTNFNQTNLPSITPKPKALDFAISNACYFSDKPEDMDVDQYVNQDIEYGEIHEGLRAEEIRKNSTINPENVLSDSDTVSKNAESQNDANYSINIQFPEGNSDQPKITIMAGVIESNPLPACTLDANSESISSGKGTTEPNLELGADPIYTVTAKNRLQMILNRYMYCIHHQSKRKQTWRWRCIDYRHKRCPAYVDTLGDTIVLRKFFHNHPLHDEKILNRGMRKRVFSSLKEVAESCNHKIEDLPYVDLSTVTCCTDDAEASQQE